VLKDRAKAFPAALALGDGHGGMEAILVGLTVLVQSLLILWVSMSGTSMLGITTQAANAYTNAAWYMPLVSFFERMTAMSIQITLSVMVWRAFTRRAWGWFAGAILYHAFIDAMAVALASFGFSVFIIEGILGVFMLVNLGLLYLAYQRWGQEPEPPVEINPEVAQENMDIDDKK
jgi:uncharacterized membrane protein YhfC